MTGVRLRLFVAALLLSPLVAAAQDRVPREEPPRAPAAPEAQTPPRLPRDPFEDMRRLDPAFRAGSYKGVVRVGTDFMLPADSEVAEVAVFGANATIEGAVDRDVLVVFGDAEIGGGAVINRSLTVIGGAVKIRDGASVRGDLVVVGGTFDAPANFTAGGDHFVLDTRAFDGRMQALIDWITKGLLWGRLIVPSLGWLWPLVGLWIVLSLVLSVLVERPVSAAVESLTARPLTASFVGLLVLLLAGPVCVLLAFSVIGIAVIPFVLCGLLVAFIIGKLAVTRRLGRGLVPEGDQSARALAIRSTAIGLALLALVYMVPVLGLLTWAIGGVFGVGASALAFLAAYRRENPLPVAPVMPAPHVEVPVFRSRTEEPEVGFEPGADPERVTIPLPAPPPRRVVNGSLLAFPRASFRDRTFAGILDLILLAILVNVFDPFIRDNAIILVGLAYFIGFWAWKGTTVGGIILQLRVVRVDGGPVGFAEALVRGLSSVFSAIVLGIGFLWILRDPERQAWQDRIAGTYVVKVPRDWPI